MVDTNVIRLPTAARRKVVQPRHDVRRALTGHLEECPAEYQPPWVRNMMRQRQGLEDTAAEAMKDNAALLIAVYLVAHADPILRAKVFGSVCHWNSLYHTAETEKAVNLVEPLMRGLPKPPGAA